ncbi:peptidoglycan DD-metalloendopeptidase family protein [Streptomyces sp. p1417]|uniref:Peptidoglycan DD-metalloendopeptidase family protein n=1 Tax=Streptomyces typhae TaxID=2681492 RepID=A0A6L6X696_9ACTN|nr:M23 family metallopeptidase [Streptomyces typhae]MVO89312.1 peptidoglycan DD-metalloendopeptidase family protein [Streptomyces typhae]
MRPPSCRPRLAPVLLCAVTALTTLLVTPSAASDGDDGAAGPDVPTAGAAVTHLYEEAQAATVRYEEGERVADAQRARVRRLDRLLAEEQHEVAVLHEDLGRMASAQYRTGGGLPLTARLLLADDPEELLRGRRVVGQADLAVTNTVARTQRAAARLGVAQRSADRARRVLDRRTAHLGRLKRDIEEKLESAQWALQGEADRSAAAGRCRGAERLSQPAWSSTRAWVTPVESYELSAGFDSAGERWAGRHTGQDFAVGIGAPVRAVGDGRVVRVACGGGFGIEVVVRHEDDSYTQYAHLASAAVDQGELVRAGQWIGQAGTTGNSTGPHLHFEARLTPHLGSGVDPVEWLAERGVDL